MNFYIEVLKFGRDNINSPISYLQLFEHCKNNKFEVDVNNPLTEASTTLQYIFENSFQDKDGKKPNGDRMNSIYFLNMEALSYLSNYEALVLTKKALWISILTLFITAVASIASIIY